MSDPVVQDITVNTWELAATATTICNVVRKKPGFQYYYTTRDTGGTAPAAISGAAIPSEAVKLFEGNQDRDIIVTNASADVYVCCFVDDSLTGIGDGKLLIGA